MNYEEVIDFWFVTCTPSQWWQKSDEFDSLIRRRFARVHQQATQGELFAWRKQPLGRLAEIIVLDQFSRNMFRVDARSFAFDAMALVLAQEAVALGVGEQLGPVQRSFLYMPYMHSESLLIHEQALNLFEANGIQSNVEFELKHKRIIERFGRYPHRNAVLARVSTSEELEFLTQPESSF